MPQKKARTARLRKMHGKRPRKDKRRHCGDIGHDPIWLVANAEHRASVCIVYDKVEQCRERRGSVEGRIRQTRPLSCRSCRRGAKRRSSAFQRKGQRAKKRLSSRGRCRVANAARRRKRLQGQDGRVGHQCRRAVPGADDVRGRSDLRRDSVASNCAGMSDPPCQGELVICVVLRCGSSVERHQTLRDSFMSGETAEKSVKAL